LSGRVRKIRGEKIAGGRGFSVRGRKKGRPLSSKLLFQRAHGEKENWVCLLGRMVEEKALASFPQKRKHPRENGVPRGDQLRRGGRGGAVLKEHGVRRASPK